MNDQVIRLFFKLITMLCFYYKEAKKSLNGNNDNEGPEHKFVSPTAHCKAEFYTRKYVDHYKGNPHMTKLFFFYMVK